MPESQFLNRVVLTNFKSIGHCDVSFAHPRSILVGPNDSGKSNFLDGLGFIADALRVSLEHAVRHRGGFSEIRCRTRMSDRIGVRVEASLRGASFRYSFTIGQTSRRDAQVLHEDCCVTDEGSTARKQYYSAEHGRVVRANVQLPPVTSPDQLYLTRVASTEEFRPLYDALAGMRFYSLNPTEIRKMPSPSSEQFLDRDGSNAASVLLALTNRSPKIKQRLDEYLNVIAPGIERVTHKALGKMQTIEFHRSPEGTEDPVVFHPPNMSDGVLRALGLLLAVFQCAGDDPAKPRLIGIEEPELTLHPNTIEVLADILDEATIHAQLVIACHSSDLLDRTEIPADSILAFENRRGVTHIGPLDDREIQMVRNRVCTPGELVRMNLLQLPSPDFQTRPSLSQPFDPNTSSDADDCPQC